MLKFVILYLKLAGICSYFKLFCQKYDQLLTSIPNDAGSVFYISILWAYYKGREIIIPKHFGNTFMKQPKNLNKPIMIIRIGCVPALLTSYSHRCPETLILQIKS